MTSELSHNTECFIQSNEFLRQYEMFSSEELFSGLTFDVELPHNTTRKKITPVLELARKNDASEIVRLYKELYCGTYPYKEMEKEQEIKKMIEDPAKRWIIFKDPFTRKLLGCITFVHDFTNKRGYIRGFLIKEEYQGKVDTVKAMLGSIIGTYCDFKGKIVSWYVENRTAHTSSQYPMYLCGLQPIGFYPNKDVFFHQVESDLMQIVYDQRAFVNYEVKNAPVILPEIKDCYEFASRKYPLRRPVFQKPVLKLNKNKIIKWKSRIKRSFTTDDFGYHYVTLSYLGSDSFFKFLYTPQVQNFEKTEYKVEEIEQLYVFIQDFMLLGGLLSVRYCESFVSAYNPEDQELFYRAGLLPRGYIPRWKFNERTNRLEDYVLFNNYAGKISENIKLISEGKKLLNYLKIKM